MRFALVFASICAFAFPSYSQEFTIDWGGVGFSQNDGSVDGTDTVISTLNDSFHGLSTATGGVAGFQFQEFLFSRQASGVAHQFPL